LSVDVTGVSGARARLKITANRGKLPILDWNVFVNGIPVLPGRDRTALSAADSSHLARTVDIPLLGRNNDIRVESSNGSALGIAETSIDGIANVPARQGTLYVAAIGVSTFADPAIPGLKYAAHDAVAVAAAFEQFAKRGLFSSVRTLVLADTAGASPTAANIKAGLAPFLADAAGQDTVIVFLASHGMSDQQGNYYFIPADARSADVQAVQQGALSAPSLLNWEAIVDQMQRTAGRRLLIVDTCSSGALAGARFTKRFDVPSLAKRSMSSNFALMAASSADEESQELPSREHGLFTFGLLEALRVGFDPGHTGAVTLSQAFVYASEKVQELRNKAVGKQTPQLIPPEELANMPLAASAPGETVSQLSFTEADGFRRQSRKWQEFANGVRHGD
jgi:hypothetical protein